MKTFEVVIKTRITMKVKAKDKSEAFHTTTEIVKNSGTFPFDEFDILEIRGPEEEGSE